MGADILPQALVGLPVQVDHFLYVHHVILDEIHHVAVGLVLHIVVDGHKGVVFIPAPVFLPRQTVAVQTAVGGRRETGMQLHQVLTLPADPAHIAGSHGPGGNLPILDGVGNFVGDNLIAKPPVQRNGIGKQHGEGLALHPHVFQTQAHQPLHDAVTRVFRIGTHAGHKANGIGLAVDIHFQRVHGDLRNQIGPVKAAQHVGPFQHRKFRLLDLVIPPARFRQLLLRHLKSVAQQLIILFQIIGGQMAHLIMGVHGVSHGFSRSFLLCSRPL